ncbi:GNAT family N-acetyltransferase [Frateuria defendens]|uniref:GNAT family N-acetyltransferase n=1 Tax=Frateuria defendens TaxID=2219559 RepID=UPI000A501405|nr:GNAT family N-acetyltransferase [Frateuria defendens]
MELQTPRLTIDALRREDAAALFAYRADQRVARYQSWRPQSEAEAQAFIAAQAALAPGVPDGWFQRAIRLRESGALVGDLGLCVPAGPRASVEFGISLAPAHQAQGLAREALRALRFVFDVLGRHRVQAAADPRNMASLALLRALGMRQEAHFRESLYLRRVDGRRGVRPAGARVARGGRLNGSARCPCAGREPWRRGAGGEGANPCGAERDRPRRGKM